MLNFEIKLWDMIESETPQISSHFSWQTFFQPFPDVGELILLDFFDIRDDRSLVLTEKNMHNVRDGS